MFWNRKEREQQLEREKGDLLKDLQYIINEMMIYKGYKEYKIHCYQYDVSQFKVKGSIRDILKTIREELSYYEDYTFRIESVHAYFDEYSYQTYYDVEIFFYKNIEPKTKRGRPKKKTPMESILTYDTLNEQIIECSFYITHYTMEKNWDKVIEYKTMMNSLIDTIGTKSLNIKQ